MEVSTLIKKYFGSSNADVSVDVFDGKNIYSVYQRIVSMLTQHIEIETTVLQAMSYCFYEILDNVLTHSGNSVTDGKGMGFGLYSTALLARDAGLTFEIHSGKSLLVYQNNQTDVLSADLWQGTKVYLELQTNKEINPHDVVANRTDCAAEYNEAFLQDNELNELW